MKILLGDFNANLGREDIFIPTAGNESLHEISNDNGVRVVNFATSEIMIVKSTMLPHCKIHKFTGTPPDGKTHNQIDHMLVDRRRHSSLLDGQSFSAKVRERLAVSKQTMHRFHMERFSLKKLNEVESKLQFSVAITNRFTAVENVGTEVDINGAWETIKREYQNFSQRDSRLLRIEEA
jgi:hypothetical protein